MDRYRVDWFKVTVWTAVLAITFTIWYFIFKAIL